ncbi:MAG: protein kinase domain-containing protein [Acidobacteriota bacterium]
MTPERWRRIEELYEAAYSRTHDERTAFLAEACRGDEALRLEVESLLSEPEPDDGFLAGPALVAASQLTPPEAPGAMSGRSLGGYHLMSLIGAGGMGEVYRARDSKLGRDVAIKILPAAFTSDPDRLARFEREARVLAALNHPNICAIHGVEEADDLRFLILELVEGESLAERLVVISTRGERSAGLPLAVALPLARQIAEALETAHDKGIVHRDLKPANIKITRDGAAKVLDFGLAKVVEGDGSTANLTRVPTLTSDGRLEGVILGTAAYMSPEQARGRTLDKRTDIWAFGCVLYEMISGRAAFAGDTVSDTIAQILEREPDWSALPPSTPPAIRRLLVRCLTKDQKQRLRDLGDARIEIDTLDRVLPGPAEAPAWERTAPHRWRRWRWLPWVALVAFAVGVGSREVLQPVLDASHPLADAQIIRFTNWEGAEEGAEVSPDGEFVAFLSDRAGEFDIWLSRVGSDSFSNLTLEFPSLAPSGAIVRKLGFSADGGQIWFNPAERKPLLLMPLTGGTPRAFLGEGTNTPARSPDGTRLVLFRQTSRRRRSDVCRRSHGRRCPPIPGASERDEA